MLLFIILCMLISPMLGIPWLVLGLYQSRNRKTIKKGYAVPFAMLFGTLGYSLRLIGEGDLTRYYAMVDNMQGRSLSYILSRDKDHLFLRDVLFYFVSRTKDNNVLAYIVGFGCYLVIFYVFFDIVNRYKAEFEKNTNIHIFMTGLVLISIINPFSVIGNVRCVFSYILISFAAYREWIQKKRNLFTLLLYILPIGLHVSAVVILIVRICVPLFKKYTKKFVLIALLVPILIRITHDILVTIHFSNFAFQFINNMVNKAYYFLNWTEGGWASEIDMSISNRIERIYGTFFLLIFIIFHSMLQKKGIIDSNGRFYNFLFVVAILALGCLSIKTGAFWRFEAVVVFFSPFILMPIALEGNKISKKILHLLYLSACVMFVYNIARFVRNVIILEVIGEYIGTSTFKVIWEVIQGINSIIGK